jgi:two-component system chemotaxis sensor kinase CheA
MNEVIREFLLETHENLAQLDLDLVTLEKEPTERETLARVFRTLHTVKGTSGFLGLTKLQAVSHSAENLLSSLRSGERFFNADVASTLLAVVDAIRTMLASIEQTEAEGEGNYSALIGTLERLRSGESPATAAATFVPKTPVASPPPRPTGVEPPAPRPVADRAEPTGADAPRPPAQASSPASAYEAPPTIAPPTVAPAPPTIAVAPPPVAPAPPTIAVAPPTIAPIPPPVAPAPPTIAPVPPTMAPSPPTVAAGPPTLAPEPPEPRAPVVSDSAIRVDVGLLDKLMTLVGEMVLARNQLIQFSGTQEDPAFLGTVQRLNLLTTELQASVMKTRMQPIGNIWSKFPRVVRDLAVACGKQARIELEGQETELDKTIIEAIRDPLTHLVRNAVDHGIEPPAERQRLAKPAEARLSLHAFHEGGKVIIEIADDGQGISPQHVRDKAIRNNLITPEQAGRLSERELVNLIFLPGFSTADRVTQFSGRGVGMDVVRTNVEKIGGTVDVESRPGLGTTVKMKIPLTLAIIPALTVTNGRDRYAIPQVSLLELVRLEGGNAQRGIELIHGAPVHRLRGNLLPLVYLNRELQSGSARDDNGEVNIVVLQADDRQFGLIVDAIHDTEEIVVKPLQKQLKGISVFSGATIMGDGKVALILDVLGLAQRANVVSGVRERSLTEKAAGAPGPTGDRQTVLLFDASDGGRMAIPLALVARLEEFPRSAIERAGAQEVVQYRGEILPLVDVSRALSRWGRAHRGRRGPRRREEAAGAASDAPVQVVVYAGNDRRVGLVVGQILDIVEETLASRSRAGRPGVLFTAVVQGRVTEFLDIEEIVRSVDRHFFDPVQPVAVEA